MPRVGLNPYALGMRLFERIESFADRGRFSVAFQRLLDAEGRKRFDTGAGTGREAIFSVRENFSDFLFINTFLDQDFINEHRLFVAGRRLNRQRGTWEYYVKSRKAGDYRQMILDTLYHPPHVEIDESRQKVGILYLVHHFEGKPLVRDYIPNTLLGIEYLWGAPVQLETSEPVPGARSGEGPGGGLFPSAQAAYEPEDKPVWQRVRYTMKDRTLSRQVLEEAESVTAASGAV
jgi:stage V sporulation protein R